VPSARHPLGVGHDGEGELLAIRVRVPPTDAAGWWVLSAKSGDDSRGSAPYLQTMGPQRFKHSKTFAGSDPTGYNTAHIFQAPTASG
jgi:hypothetical protein